jgi:hypothetical protein
MAETTQTATSKPSRRTLRKLGRDKRVKRLRTEAEFRKAYFEAKSKRSTDTKSAFRKKKKGKKA